MAIVCPAILASNTDDYAEQVRRVAGFARRIQIDITDGLFAKNQTVQADDIWWPVGVLADIHIMYNRPLAVLPKLLVHPPHMIIAHAESEGDFEQLSRLCKSEDVKVGIALLPDTPVEVIMPALPLVDHVLIFSGQLGHFGGHADMGLLRKVHYLKSYKPSLEIGWDGGISDKNVARLVAGGVDVLNTGGYIQKAQDPQVAFVKLQSTISSQT